MVKAEVTKLVEPIEIDTFRRELRSKRPKSVLVFVAGKVYCVALENGIFFLIPPLNLGFDWSRRHSDSKRKMRATQ